MKRALSTVFALVSLAACSGSQDGAAGQGVGEEQLTKAPPFLGAGSTRTVKIDGADSRQLATSSGLDGLVDEMSRANHIQNISFAAGAFKLDAAHVGEWSSKLNCRFTQNKMAYDLLFRADGSTPGGTKGLGFQDEWHPEFETMRCQEMKDKTRALSRFKRFEGYVGAQGDTQIPAAKRQLLEKNAGLAVGSLMRDVGAAKLFNCHWDNTDDSSADALVRVDEKTGEIRVLLAFSGA
jgi:hypothetical protein